MIGRSTRTIAVVTWVLVAVAMPGARAQVSGHALALAPGEPAPKLVGWGFDQTIQSFSYDGRLTLVNFWATWCEPCREEMPALQALLDRFGDDGLQVVGFNQEREATVDQVVAHLEDLGVSYPNLKPDARFNWGGINTIPTSFLVGPDGMIMRKYIGARPEQVAGLERDVEDAMNGRPLKAMVLPKPTPPPSDED